MGDALASRLDHVAVEDQRSIISDRSISPEPETITKLVKRIRALVTKLLPVDVELSSISEATSSIITPKVIEAFSKCGGDFSQAVPFCLLRARAMFKADSLSNPADYDESLCRAVACEVLARRIVHNLSSEALENVMSTRFRYRDSDGDISAAASVLESAIDQHCTIFLSSTEAQYVVNALWKGDWVQRNSLDDEIDYVPYHHAGDERSVWSHLNCDRMAVPRYQSLFRICVWLVFVFVYSATVRSPLDSINPEHEFDEWEWVLYFMTLSFLFEEAVKVVKTIRLASRPLATIGFWTIVNFATDALLLSAFTLRIAGLWTVDEEGAQLLQFRSFQVLSCAAPLIWIRMLTVFEGFKIVGVIQVIVFRMLRESAIFFILLAIMAVGFAQSMYALDAADGESGGGTIVINALIQALLGSPDFGSPTERFGYPFGLIIYYSWNFLATIILVNVLIALFGSAYSDVSENSTDEYLAFFASKTVSLIRAPDTFVYPAPFNLIEGFLIAPLEFILPTEWYIALNRAVMPVIFFVPLTLIALFEAYVAHGKSVYLRQYFSGPPEVDEEGDPRVEDPACENDDGGEISKLKFDELVKAFPNTALTESAVILGEIKAMRDKLDALEKVLSAK